MRRALILLVLLLVSCSSFPPMTPAIPPSSSPTVPGGEATLTTSPVVEPVSSPVEPAPSSTEEPAATITSTPEPAPREIGAVPAPNIFDIAWNDRSVFRSGLIDSQQAVLDQLSGASVYHIDLQVAGDSPHLDGREEVRYTNQEQTPLNEVYFWLFPNLLGGTTSVSGLKVNGVDVEPSYESNKDVMRVPLSESLQPGEQIVIRMDFSVEVPTEAGRNYGILASLDGVMALAHFYPMIAVYDAEGWHITAPPEYGDVVYNDASFYLVRVTAPANQTVVASGVEIDRSQADSGDQVVTLAAGPARDFYLVLSDRYQVTSRTLGQTTINSYAFPDHTAAAGLVLDYTAGALDSFDTRFGPYPYTELDLAATETSALGVEYPGAIALTDSMYDLSSTIAGLPARAILESSVAHEVAHQWFYNVVGNDQVNQPWLDEAMAQYATYLYYEDAYGPAGAQAYRQSWESRWARVDDADIPIGMPVKDYNPTAYGAIIYGRGPLFIEALDQKMGEQTFDAFLHDYYRTYKWGIATTAGFEHVAEQDCGCDLMPLFDQWVYGQ